MGDFLLELYSEEIPAKMQITARDQLERLFKKKLDKSSLKASEIIGFVTPVRLGVIIKKLTFDKSGEKEEIRGPRVGAPDLAIQGFLKKNKILHNQLTLKKTEKGEFYVYERAIAKRSISEVLALISTEIISEFSWPKSMLWGSDYSLRWIRPLKNILALLFLEEEKVLIPIKVRGIASDIFTKGHSFMSPRPFQVESLAQYQTKLLEGKVILQPEDRLKRISEMAQELCRKSGFKVVEDKSLVDEITGTRGRGNKECVGQGLANTATGLFGGMGGCAMIGQSMINVNSGGRGRLSGITAALCLLAFILIASPLIEMIPVAALVGVMFIVVLGTFEWSSFRIIPKIPKSEIGRAHV